MRSAHRLQGRLDEQHARPKPDAGAAGCAAGWAATCLPPWHAQRASSRHLPKNQHLCRSRHQLLPRHLLEHRHRHACATGSPPIAIDAKRQSNHCGMPRGFLPWGLSNTCPQGGAMRSYVACDGQVSDNPKHFLSVATGSFPARRRAGPGPTPRRCTVRCTSDLPYMPTAGEKRGQRRRAEPRVVPRHFSAELVGPLQI